MKRTAAVVLASISALALMAAPASADSTVHYDYPEACYDYGGGTTVCSSGSGQYHYTTTPSGNTSYVGKNTSRFSVTSPYGSYSDTYDSKVHSLVKQGELFVYSAKYDYAFTVGAQTCTFADNLHFANGEVRHMQPEYSCV